MKAKDLLSQCPFYDTMSGRMRPKWRASWDRVFIWQKPAAEQVGSILIPDTVKDEYRPQIGVVVSVGEGWHDDKCFYPMRVLPTWVVLFDLRTPWHMQVENHLGEFHAVRYMGEQDVRCVIDPEQELAQVGELYCRGNFTKRVLHLGGLA